MKSSLAILATSLAAIAAAQATTLVNWNLNTVTGPTENNATFTGVPTSTATVTANVSVTDLITASSSGHGGLVWSSGNADAGKLNLQRWDHPNDNPNSFGNGNGNPNNWLQFTLSADAGYLFTLTSVDIAAWRNGGGAPAAWSIQYHDGAGWVNFGSSHTETNAGDSIFRDVTYTGSVTSTALDLRFIATGPSGGSGNLHINQLQFDGTVALIPEPTTALLGALGLLALLRRRR